MTDKLFSSTKDRQVIDAGGFFCQACLIGKPLDTQSSDPRYCLECFNYLVLGMGADPGTGDTTIEQGQRQGVAKIETNGNLPPDLEKGIMQQGKGVRGRPIKEGPVHRSTEWRRQKAQGVLV